MSEVSDSARRTAAVVLVAMLSGVCADDGGSEEPAARTTATVEPTTTSASAPEPVDGILATIEVNRLFSSTRPAFGLGLRNTGPAARVVAAIGIESPLFETVPWRPARWSWWPAAASS